MSKHSLLFYQERGIDPKTGRFLKGRILPDRGLDAIEKIRKSKIGSNNPNWKGNNITEKSGRSRAERLYPAPKGKDRHHIDGNPCNNHPDNIRIRTRKEHMIEDGRLEFLKRRKRNAKGQLMPGDKMITSNSKTNLEAPPVN